jgi:uncharacterized protein with HEPN domain
MQPRDASAVLDMCEFCRRVIEYARGRTFEEFVNQTQLQDSILHPLVLIGEAASRVSSDARSSLPEVPWSKVVGMRNIVVHAYDSVDLELVWVTVTDSIPALLEQLLPSLAPEDGRLLAP